MADVVTTSKVILTAEDKTAPGFDSAQKRGKDLGSTYDELARRYGTAQAAVIQRAMEAERAFAGQVEGMQRARAEVAAMQRALDSLGAGNRDIARAILGTRGTYEIQNEIRLITAALDQLRQSANIGPQELARASVAAQQKLAALRAELAGIPQQVGAIGGAAAPLPALFQGMLAPLIALGTFAGIKHLATQFFELADANTLLQARLKALTGSTQDGQRAFVGLAEDARRLRVPIEDAGSGLTRIAGAVLELGGTVGQARQLNEVLLSTAKISGVSGQEAAAAARQFAQALGSGVLQGDELRSILENNQELARELARGLGVAVGELKKLGSEGKLTADVVANALLSRLPEIRAKMADVPVTVADAFSLLKNEIFLFVGELNKATGAGNAFAGVLTGIADGLGNIRAQFADGGIAKGMASISALQSAAFLSPGGAIAGLTALGKNNKVLEDDINVRDQLLARAERSALGVAAAAKRAYNDATKVGQEFLTKQQKITQEFGANMQTIAKAIEAQQQAIEVTPAGAERAAATAKLVDLEKLRAAAMADVVKKIAEANAADAKRNPLLKELSANQKAYNSVLEQVAGIAANAREALDSLFMDESLTKAEIALRKLGDSDAWKKLTVGQQAYITDTLLAAAETERLTKRLQEQARAAGEFAAGRAKEYADWEKEVNKATDSYTDLIAKLNAETEALNDTGSQRERYLALLKLEQQMNEGLIVSMDEYTQRLNAINEAFDRRDAARATRGAREDAIKAEQKAYQDLYNWIDQQTTALWAAVTQKGGDAWKKITEVFKNTLLAAIYKLAVQPIVFNIVASVTGVAAPGGGVASGLGSLFGGGSGGLGGIFGGITNAFDSLSFAFSDFTQLLGQGVGLFQSASTAFGGLLPTLGSALPVVGAIAAIVPLIAGLFSKGGGPKSGGFSSLGDIAGIANTDSGGRWFTPSQGDADLAKTLDAVNQGYLDITRQLGLTARDIGFALGFDTDPKGKAPNRVHSGTFVDGQQIYDAALGDLGRDEKVLQEALATEAKRVLFAALQASLGDAPEYLRKLFEGIDAATASSAQIDEVLATAQALKTIVDTVAGMGERFAAMDPEQITALTEAFGGLQGFLDSAAFLQTNFTTDAERAAQATETLGEAFAALNIEVPATHQAFTDLLASLDLTTAEGRASYAAISKLGPLFVSVFGTAQQAADQTAEATRELAEVERELADARRDAIDSATDFFQANFYGDQEQAARELDANWQIVHQAWTEMGAQLLALGLTHIPTTNAAFRELIESLRGQGLNDLADSLILLAPTIFDINDAIATLSQTAQEAGETISSAVDDISVALQQSATNAGYVSEYFGTVWGAIQQIASGGGDFSEKLALTMKLSAEQITKWQAELDKEGNPYTPLAMQLKQMIAMLEGVNAKAAAQLARYVVLSAQYDAARAEQLVELEEWYANMQQALIGPGNEAALEALKQQFDDRWQAIIDGVSGGVNGAISELERLRQGIRDFIDSLKIGELSPLTPAQKLAEAQAQYQALLVKAQGGDLEALGQITGAAQAYLQIAQQYFGGSTPQYVEIFNSVIAALEALTITKQPPVTERQADQALVAALPTNGRMVSSKDLEDGLNKLAAEFVQGLNSLALANRQDSEAEREAIASGPPQGDPLK
jgi:tape measure domain-containing protein